MNEIIPQDIIEQKIFLIRSQKVMLDRDLAVLYEVETKILNKAVRRNIERFPSDFMFQLTKDEFDNLKFQFGTSSWGGTRKLPLLKIGQFQGQTPFYSFSGNTSKLMLTCAWNLQ
jgi:hypothetical protein